MQGIQCIYLSFVFISNFSTCKDAFKAVFNYIVRYVQIYLACHTYACLDNYILQPPPPPPPTKKNPKEIGKLEPSNEVFRYSFKSRKECQSVK